jgi:plasmid stability protein
MTDLLIRNITASLKKKLASRARKNRRSLSDEVKRLLDEALVEKQPAKPLGSALAEHFKGLVPVELDIPRSTRHRPPPEFE